MTNAARDNRLRAMIGGSIAAAQLAFASGAAGFETDIWAGATPASAIEVNWYEVGLVEGLPETIAGWVLIRYPQPVNCSPPRGCYANAQRAYVFAFCSTAAIKDIQRISFDLNGNAVAESGERVAYKPTYGSADRSVVSVLCEAYGFYAPRWREEDDYDPDRKYVPNPSTRPRR